MRLALPLLPTGRQIEVKEMTLEQEKGCLALNLRLTNGETFHLPMSDEAARGLGRALLAATDRIIFAGAA